MSGTNRFGWIINIALLLSIIVNIFFIGNHFEKKYSASVNHVIYKKPPYYLNRQTIFDKLPITSNDVVFAGDSHTEFFEVNEYFHDCSIKNRGIYADVSRGLLNRMNQIIPGKPKKIFIEIGFNDIGTDISVDSTCTNIKLIIEQIKKQSPKTSIYINSIFPSGRDYYRKPVQVMNNKIKKLCMAYNVPYVDVYTKLSVDGLLDKRYNCGDGIHLSGAGYAVWTACLKPFL